jgi:O-succinylbenzoic acid--CoA ligase
MTRTVPDWLAGPAMQSPDAMAVQGETFTWTFAELDATVDGLAARLRERVGEGGRVAALLADDAPAVALLHAVRRVRVALVPLNRRATTAELGEQVQRVRPAVLVHDAMHEARAKELATGGPLARLAAEAALAGGGGTAPPRGEHPRVDPDSVAVILLTSGTTARPRAAALTHGCLAASADAWATVLRPRPTDRWLACLPLFHVAGLAVIIRAARWGVPVEVLTRFTPDRVAERIEAGISHLSVVASQLGSLVEAVGHPPSTLRAILVGGGPIPGTLVARARSAGFPVLTTYGMTETGSGIAVGGADRVTLSDTRALRPLPGVDVRIADPDARGEGTIHVRGPMIFEGYLDDPAATAERLRDGWLDTGDIGRIDEDGCLHVLDRRDDLIVSGGENVSPAEVEAVLLAHPDVREAAVVGQPDPAWGSVPVAAIVLSAGSLVADASLERHCRERLAGYKVPARFHRVDRLPRNAAGKVVRRDLRRTLGLVDR